MKPRTYASTTKKKKLVEFHVRIMKIMKTLKLFTLNYENHENLRISIENHENH